MHAAHLCTGVECSSKKFKEELTCPLCDTVLPKDGVGELNLRPDKAAIQKASLPAFGMQPKQLCEILQNGLEFWAEQQKNENIMYMQAQEKFQQDLQKEKTLNRRLTTVRTQVCLVR